MPWPLLTKDFELVPRMLTKAQLTEAFRCSHFGSSGVLSPAEEATATADAIGGENDGGSDSGPPPAPPRQQAEDFARIGFEEFVDAVGRLALMAFRFREPAEAAPTLGFQGSYEAAAKALWLDDSRQTLAAEANFPDEISMPAAAAMADGGFIGNDDRPRIGGGGGGGGAMDDMMSRAASRCFSRARSTIGKDMGRTVRYP